MAPARAELPVSWAEIPMKPYDGPPRNLASINELKFDESLKPKNYQMHSPHSESKILILDVNILDSTGKEPYHGDVFIEGKIENLRSDKTPFELTTCNFQENAYLQLARSPIKQAC